MKMSEISPLQHFETAAADFRHEGWDVWAKRDRIGGAVLYARPAADDGSGTVFAFGATEMRAHIHAGRVARLKPR